MRKKVGQLAHPLGGRQPKDKGLAKGAKVLGITREEFRRAEKTDGICAEAKDAARQAGLDDVQKLLLEIAKEPPEKQVEKVQELKERRSKPRGRGAGSAGSSDDTPAKSTKEESDTPRHRTDEPNESDDSEVESPSIAPNSAEPGNRRTDADEIDAPDSDKPNAGAHTGEKYERLKRRWEKYVEPDWKETSAADKARFIMEVLRKPALPKDK